MFSNLAFFVLFVVPIVAFWVAWSSRKALRAWLFASAIAPTYLLFVVLFRFDHFGGWFDVAFVVITLSGIFLSAIGALVGRVALRKRARDA